jgi:hypothetical protein
VLKKLKEDAVPFASTASTVPVFLQLSKIYEKGFVKLIKKCRSKNIERDADSSWHQNFGKISHSKILLLELRNSFSAINFFY